MTERTAPIPGSRVLPARRWPRSGCLSQRSAQGRARAGWRLLQREVRLEVDRMRDADGCLGVDAEQHNLDVRRVGEVVLPLVVGVDRLLAIAEASMFTSRRSRRS